MRHAIVSTAVAAVLGGPVLAWAATGDFARKDFQVLDGDWNEPTNWNQFDDGNRYVPGASPNFFNDARILNGRTATLSDDVTAYTGQLRNVAVGNGTDPGRLNITATGWLGTYGSVNSSEKGSIDVQGKISAVGISTDGALAIKPGAVVNLTAQWQFNVGATGTVDFTGGTITDLSSNSSGGWRVSGGTVNHSAGSVTMSRGMEIGGAAGTYNLSGTGTVDLSGISLGYLNAATGSGTLNVSGGELHLRGGLNLLSYQGDSTGHAEMTISGGVVTVANDTRVGNPGNLGSATLRVVGNQGSITLGNVVNNGVSGLHKDNQNAPLIVWQNGTLNFVIGAEGISTLNLTSADSSDNARSVSYLAGTLDIDLMDGFAPSLGQTFDLASTNVTGGVGIDITGLTLAMADQPYWSFAVVAEGENRILRLTNTAPIPEPTSLSLLGLGGLALLARRRRVKTD